MGLRSFTSAATSSPLVLSTIVVLGIAGLVQASVAVERHIGRQQVRRVLTVILAVCILCIGVITLGPGPVDTEMLRPYNLMPFESFRESRRSGAEAIGNIILFAPVGTVLSLLTRVALRSVTVATFLSVCIESLQFILASGRYADVDDVLLNALGAAIGVSLVATFLMLSHRLSAQATCRETPSLNTARRSER